MRMPRSSERGGFTCILGEGMQSRCGLCCFRSIPFSGISILSEYLELPGHREGLDSIYTMYVKSLPVERMNNDNGGKN